MDSKHVILSKNQLLALQKKEVEILKSVISAINQMGLTYYCVGGTALGAVKYGDFVPWDDDIDIAMPRQDYMVFLKEGAKFLPPNLFIQSVYSEKKYFLGVTKVRDKSTTFYDLPTASLDICHGVFIDIFPIDGYSKKKTKTGSLIWKLRFNKITWSNYYKPEKHSLAQFLTGLVSRVLLFFESPNKSCRKNEELLMKEKFESHQEVFMRTENFDKALFGIGKKATFCGLDVMVPEKVEVYLELCYGDISNDPPLSKQYPHHFAMAIDVKVPYSSWIFKKGKLQKR